MGVVVSGLGTVLYDPGDVTREAALAVVMGWNSPWIIPEISGWFMATEADVRVGGRPGQ